MRRPHRDGRGRRGACARAPSSCPADVRLLGGEQGGVPGLRGASPLVEGLSIDEAFLDVRGLEQIVGPPEEIAVRAAARRRERVGLPITVGVARTKFLAKVASGVAKPDGLLVVPPDRELAFLHRLPVERLWGVGPVTSRKLRGAGSRPSAEVARLPERALVSILGRATGRHLHALAHNHDPRPVQARRRRAFDRLAARSAAAPAGGAGREPRRARGSRCAAAAGGGTGRPDGRPPPALRGLHAGDALAHAAPGDGEAERSSRRPGAPRRGAAVLERRGLTLSGSRSPTSPRRRGAARAAVRGARRRRARRRPGRVRDRYGRSDHPRRPARPRAGFTMPVQPD